MQDNQKKKEALEKDVLDAEAFFISTINEIKERIERGDNYSIIKASGLLRLLFLDGHSLVNRVNRSHKIKLKFLVNNYLHKPPFEPMFWYFNIDPSRKRTRVVFELNLPRFLNVECLSYQGTYYTVRDVIKVCAHIKGGAHYGDIKSDDEKILSELDAIIRIGKDPLLVMTLKDIIGVSLAGVKLLEEAVRLKNDAIGI
ncbi:MAG: hypothetical protein KDI13_02020 [Alphaproteobacteria bacterium]|nr:hypothetical protein [Alphaproteobacteria bacterium]